MIMYYDGIPTLKDRALELLLQLENEDLRCRNPENKNVFENDTTPDGLKHAKDNWEAARQNVAKLHGPAVIMEFTNLIAPTSEYLLPLQKAMCRKLLDEYSSLQCVVDATDWFNDVFVPKYMGV